MIGLESRSRRPALFFLLILISCAALSQDKKPEKQVPKGDKSPFTFKVPVDVVIVNASVADKKGMPVLDLAADDFKVYEDGKQQPIHTFTLESYKITQPSSTVVRKPAAGARTNAKEESSPSFNQPQLLTIVIDDVATSIEFCGRVLEAARKFIEEDLAPGDQVAIMSGSGSVQYPFTTDRQLLLAEVNGFFKHLAAWPMTKSSCPSLTDLQAERIVDQLDDQISLSTAIAETGACLGAAAMGSGVAERTARMAALAQHYEVLYRSRVLLKTLRQYARSLQHIEAKKSITLFSDGFIYEDLLYDLQDVVDQALRAGVVLNTVDVRGLYVPMFDASQNIVGISNQDFLEKKSKLLSEDASVQEVPLVMLARDTGGIFQKNTNDLHAALKQAAEREAYYYVLSYATPSQKADGRYHKITLEVSRPDLELLYRPGYYAPKEELTFERKKKEDILDALRAPGNLNEIPVGFSYNSYQVDDSNYEVELVTRVDIRRMRFVEEDSWRKNQISIAIVLFDDNDRYIDGSLKDVSFSLSPDNYAEILSRGFSSTVKFRMPPGRYKIKAIIREAVQGKIGSLTKTIDVP